MKLNHGAKLSDGDERQLTALARHVRKVEPRCDIVPAGSGQRFIALIVGGWACRYRDLQNGKRQITTIYLPGDLCEPFGILPSCVNYAISAVTKVAFSPVAIEGVAAAAHASGSIRSALWWDLLSATSIEREHIVSLGRRSAPERLGHLFCELHLRLSMIGRVAADSYDMPLTQEFLGDMLGLTSVHVNRSLQDLRRSGLITLSARRVTINNVVGLQELSYFDPSYLHFDKGKVR